MTLRLLAVPGSHRDRAADRPPAAAPTAETGLRPITTTRSSRPSRAPQPAKMPARRHVPPLQLVQVQRRPVRYTLEDVPRHHSHRQRRIREQVRRPPGIVFEDY